MLKGIPPLLTPAAGIGFAIVQTGERRFHGNVLPTKGVIPP